MAPTVLSARILESRSPGVLAAPAPPPTPPGRWDAAGRELGWAAAAVAVFVSLVSLPRVLAADDIDPSWVQTLAHLQRRGATPGTDFVFSYGPLFYLVQHPYHPDTFVRYAAGELAFQTVLTLLLVRLARRLRPGAGAGLLLAVTGFALANLPTEAPLMVAALAAAWLPVADDSRRGNLLLGVPFLAAAGLAKFTLFPFAVCGLSVLTAYRVADGLGWTSVAPAAGFAAVTAGLWGAAGHALADFPAYVRGGFEFAAGYSEGMTLPGPVIETRLALLAAGLCAAWVVLAGWGRPRTPRSLAGLALVALAAAVVWKHGFVRHDAHPVHFFTFVAIVPLVLPLAMTPGRPTPFRGLLAAAAVAAAVGCYEVLAREKGVPSHSLLTAWQNRAADLLRPGRLRERLDNDRHDLALRHDLPAVRERVGGEPIDVFTESQGVALLNGLNLAPRPTVQSNNACSPAMAGRNRAHLTGPHASRFALLKLAPIDGRYPTLADGPALLELARRYRPVLRERGFLLLERGDADPPPAFAVEERTATIGERFAVPDAANRLVTLRLDVGRTAWGAARTAAFRSPELYLDVWDDAGERRRFRITPGMARSEFLLAPLCADTDGFAALWEAGARRRVVGAAVCAERAYAGFFRDTVGVTLTSYPR